MGIMESMAFSTTFSRHFMATEVSATGGKSFKSSQVNLLCLPGEKFVWIWAIAASHQYETTYNIQTVHHMGKCKIVEHSIGKSQIRKRSVKTIGQTGSKTVVLSIVQTSIHVQK